MYIKRAADFLATHPTPQGRALSQFRGCGHVGITRIAWLVGMRASRSTYANNDPIIESDQRIAASSLVATQESLMSFVNRRACN